MATVNLGAIKFKWKGTYNALTAYTIDDVVSYNGSSYICIQASTGNLPTDTAYFEQMSSAGTNGTDGTDLGTTLTTQGDIVYRDASGLARLGAGTSGQVLQTGGAGANPSWGTVSSDFVLIETVNVTSDVSQVEIQDCFSSTYQDYKLLIKGRTTTTAQYLVEFANGSAGSSYRTNNYNYNGNRTYINTAGTNGHQSIGAYGDAYFRFRENVDSGAEHFKEMIFDIYSPFSSTEFTNVRFGGVCWDGTYINTLYLGGNISVAESHYGVKIYTGAGNVEAGSSVSVYGIKK